MDNLETLIPEWNGTVTSMRQRLPWDEIESIAVVYETTDGHILASWTKCDYQKLVFLAAALDAEIKKRIFG